MNRGRYLVDVTCINIRLLSLIQLFDRTGKTVRITKAYGYNNLNREEICALKLNVGNSKIEVIYINYEDEMCPL